MKDDYNLEELEKISVRGLTYNVMPRYKYHYLDHSYEKFSLDLIDHLVKGGSTVIDIGAHYGIYSLLASKRAKKVYAFEPVPENHEILNRNKKDNKASNITTINGAVSHVSETAVFNMPWASDSAGFYDHPNAESVRKIEVQTYVIDNEVKEKNISLVKIDTEGHEIHVLEGMHKTIARNADIKLLIEFNPECLERAGYMPLDLVKKILSLDLDIFAIYEDERHIVRVTENTPIEQILQGREYLNLLCLKKGSWINPLFISHNSSIGGAELALLETVQGMVANKDIFVLPYVVFSADGPLVNRFADMPVASKIAYMHGWNDEPGSTSNDRQLYNACNATAISTVAKIIDDFQPNVCISNTMVMPWGAVAARALSVPHIWQIHEFGNIDHGIEFSYGYENTLSMIDELSAGVVVYSNAVKRHVNTAINPNKITLLNPSINVPDKVKSADIFSKKATLKITLSGRLSESKGQLDAVKALVMLRNDGHEAELTLVGDNTNTAYLNAIQSYASENNISEYVHIVGHQNDPFPYVAAADVVLVCSANEALGRVTIEALLLGKPVIGTDSGATPEILKHGGKTYNAGDIDALASSIATLSNEKDRTKLSKSGQKFARSMYVNSYSDDFIAYVNRIAKTKVSTKVMPYEKDLLVGGATALLGLNDEIAKRENKHRQELADFSDKYNEVYSAYNAVSKELQEIHRNPAHKVITKVGHGVRRVKRKVTGGK